MLVYCFCSVLLQDLFLSLQVFAFEGQNMTFTVNALLARILCLVFFQPSLAMIISSAIASYEEEFKIRAAKYCIFSVSC